MARVNIGKPVQAVQDKPRISDDEMMQAVESLEWLRDEYDADNIELSDWEWSFVDSLLDQLDRNPDYHYTKKQFETLNNITAQMKLNLEE